MRPPLCSVSLASRLSPQWVLLQKVRDFCMLEATSLLLNKCRCCSWKTTAVFLLRSIASAVYCGAANNDYSVSNPGLGLIFINSIPPLTVSFKAFDSFLPPALRGKRSSKQLTALHGDAVKRDDCLPARCRGETLNLPVALFNPYKFVLTKTPHTS